MCGFAGVWASVPIEDPDQLAGRLDSALAHRGPDGHAWTNADSGRGVLVHRRLAIIECGAGGRQPMTSADGRYTIVFNGEIYNHAELRCALEQCGERFVSRSDTEVLMRLVVRRGPDALADVRGMFAFALWDAERRTLMVARDRFGIKPLYVAAAPTRVAFSSEIRALLVSGVCQRTIDPAGVRGYLEWGTVPAPLTWVRGIEALEPGTWTQWSSDFSLVCGRFADVRETWETTASQLTGPEELREHARSALDDSVRAHLVADVPVGFFLSGGIDSGALVATAAATGVRAHTFTVVVNEASHDEEAPAREVASHFGTIHETLRVDSSLVSTEWPSMLRHMDQPTIDGINSYFVSSAVARTGIKAVISGIGGDEAFGGYPSFARVARGARLGHIPRALRTVAGRVVAQRELPWRARKVEHAAIHADSAFELYRAVRGWLMPREIEALAGPALRDRDTVDRLDAAEARVASAAHDASVYACVARLESTMYLRNQLLRDVDVMSMAHGLEVRVPFVDHRLLSAVWPALGAHPRLLTHKRLLVEALGGRIPPALAARPKQGFTLPFEHWIDGALAEFVRDGLQAAARDGWLEVSAPARVLHDWRSRACHWSRPWGLAVLGHFLRND